MSLQDIDPVPTELLTQPLDWFFAEHYRHRQVCTLITTLAAEPDFDGRALTLVVEFIRNDLALHVIDEEEDLFPLLRRRALAEDEIEPALGRLSSEHKADIAHAQLVREGLEACLADRRAPSRDAAISKAMRDFASQEMRHLALENAIVLPIARLRLSDSDLAGLSRRLGARRGVILPVQPA
ncbi:MAG TPA: hemerythrin domain-containing protein [Caulobacter sp.]|nr:hemerythrin domain-containing protein [Caulobacter sp.]